MKHNLFIPKTITVGYQERNNTYTKKLAYVIYTDEKGVLRKEGSWNSWRNHAIKPNTFDNVPTEGFVLNKKAGGYSSGWNHRQTYVRVYDPRGFEFEITIENLLYILENATSTKGKGLEGEFIYSWDGKDLVLMPVESPDYKEITEYNEKLHNKIKLKGKDLKVGGTYLTSDNKELIYIGRFDHWDTDYRGASLYDEVKDSYYPQVNKGKIYWFYDKKGKYNGFELIRSLNKIISVISEDCDENYADIFEELQCKPSYSPFDRSKDEYVPYELDEFIKEFKKHTWSHKIIGEDMKYHNFRFDVNNGDYTNFKEERIKYVERKNWGYGGYDTTVYEPCEDINSIEDIYNKYKPLKKIIYLTNGRQY